jgi:hypothetical protein
MPDLDSFEAEVRDKIKLLSSKDAKTRIKAAQWLGEAGDPTAITALAQTYKVDDDPAVQEAARYSLGMFRKLDEVLNGSDTKARERAMKLLEDVALKGKMGRRTPIPTRRLIKFELGLLISAILVAVLSFILPPLLRGSIPTSTNTVTTPATQTTPPTALPQAADKDRPTLINDLRNTLTLASNNATKLQTQYQNVLGGGTIPCTEFFDTVSPFGISERNTNEFADLAQIAADLNTAIATLQNAKAAYDRVCDNSEVLEAAAFGGPMRDVVSVIQSLPTIQTALDTAAAAS